MAKPIRYSDLANVVRRKVAIFANLQGAGKFAHSYLDHGSGVARRGSLERVRKRET
jgi:hypothetical protein